MEDIKERYRDDREDTTDEEVSTHVVEAKRVVWESGCLHVDRDATKFFATYLLSLIVLIFSFYMISRDSDDSQLALWSSIVTGIASQYLPSPLLNEVKK